MAHGDPVKFDFETYIVMRVKNKIKFSGLSEYSSMDLLNCLEDFDINNAKYTVHIKSFYRQYGERTIDVTNIGSLEDTIKLTEERFKEENHREHIQATYGASISLGKSNFVIPGAYLMSIIHVLTEDKTEKKVVLKKLIKQEGPTIIKKS